MKVALLLALTLLAASIYTIIDQCGQIVRMQAAGRYLAVGYVKERATHEKCEREHRWEI